MADFDVRFSSGVSTSPWLDPEDTGKPSRVNPKDGYTMKRAVGTVGVPVEMTARIDSGEAPLDSELDDRLFFVILVECPGPRPPMIPALAQTSVQTFTPLLAGHYHVRWRRPDGGIWHLHVDIEEP